MTTCVLRYLRVVPSCRPLKIREEADPFSLDMGVMEKGSIVKVLEVRHAIPVSYTLCFPACSSAGAAAFFWQRLPCVLFVCGPHSLAAVTTPVSTRVEGCRLKRDVSPDYLAFLPTAANRNAFSVSHTVYTHMTSLNLNLCPPTPTPTPLSLPTSGKRTQSNPRPLTCGCEFPTGVARTAGS